MILPVNGQKILFSGLDRIDRAAVHSYSHQPAEDPMSPDPAPPDSQEAVLGRLLADLDRLPTQLQITARFIIDHPREVGVRTMRSLAGQAGVHPNSFVRLARHLGFAGYDDMRERFRDFVRGGAGSFRERARWLQSMARQGGSAAVSGEMAAAVLANIEQLYRGGQLKAMERAVRWMSGAKQTYVVGVGSSYALAHNFWYVARMMHPHFILIPRHGSLPMDDILHVGPRDVLFAMTFQPYRTEIVEVMRFARERGARTIGLSDSRASPVFREAGLGLFAPTHTPQFFHSGSATTALLETLCALMASEGGERVLAEIEAFNERRWQSGVYLK